MNVLLEKYIQTHTHTHTRTDRHRPTQIAHSLFKVGRDLSVWHRLLSVNVIGTSLFFKREMAGST